jgi:hypothetical protein
MPFMSCPNCSLRIFSAERYAARERCPGCGLLLPIGTEADAVAAAQAEVLLEHQAALKR